MWKGSNENFIDKPFAVCWFSKHQLVIVMILLFIARVGKTGFLKHCQPECILKLIITE